MARKYYLALAVGAAAAILMSAGPLAAGDDCEDKEAKKEVRADSDDKVVYADKNNDGKVTRSEAKVDNALQRVFGHYDRNDDDTLDRAEFAQLEDDRVGGMHSGERRQAGENPDVITAGNMPQPDSAGYDDRLRPRQTAHQNPP